MVTINPSNFVYDHKVHRPYVKVIDGKTTLKEETDYTISYTGTVNAGQGNVIVKGIGKLVPCEPFSSEEVTELTSGRDREFDFTFLRRIEKIYLENDSPVI